MNPHPPDDRSRPSDPAGETSGISGSPFDRRRWLGLATGGCGGFALAALSIASSAPLRAREGGEDGEDGEDGSPGIRHFLLPLLEAPEREPDEGLVTGFRRFGWKAFAVGEPGAEASLLGAASATPLPEIAEGDECRLRLTNAIDVRAVYAIEVTLPGGEALGTFDLRFAGLYQVQEIPLTAAQARAVLAQGAVLTMRAGPGATFFFAPSEGAAPGLDPVQLPHLMVASGERSAAQRSEAFEERLRGLAMLQGFGWQSGCVAEGLLDLGEARGEASWLAALDRYQAMYFTGSGVEFESPRSRPMRNQVGGVEEPLPWATLARRHPEHPAIRIAAEFLPRRTDSSDAFAQGNQLTTEACYTAAYPAAVLSRTLGREDLAALALRIMEHRHLGNVHGERILQRGNAAGEGRLPNWCRGVCWYYLGIVRTLEALDDAAAVVPWQEEIARVAEFLLRHQREDGLWGNFVHDPDSLHDTSGSAGLAAALARASRRGWLGEEALEAAKRTREGLVARLTPDGLLGGAAQSNKGGDGLQTGSYRVLYQMGMGLMAQLVAALEE